MLDLTNAENRVSQLYFLKDRAFTIRFETYNESSGGIDYSKSKPKESRLDWWIWNVEVEFNGDPIGNFGGGYKLKNIQEIINKRASEYIRKTYNDLIY